MTFAFDSLSSDAATLAGRLTLLAGPDFAAPAAATLLDVSIDYVNDLLGELFAAGLLVEKAADRFALQSICCEYAENRLNREDKRDRDAALSRAIQHYLLKAATVELTLAPGKHRQAALYSDLVPLDSRALAVACFEADQHNIIGTQRLAVQLDDHEAVWKLGEALWTVLREGAHAHDLAEVQRRAAKSAGLLRHPYESAAHARHGWALTSLGRHDEAITACHTALRSAKRHADAWSTATAHAALARAYRNHGQAQNALEHLELAIRADQLWDAPPWVIGLRLRQRAEILSELDRHDEAATEADTAVHLMLFDPERRTETGRTYSILGRVLRAAGRPEQAIEALLKADPLLKDSGSRIYRAENNLLLGDAHHDRGDLPAAHTRYADASDLYRSAGHLRYAEVAQSRLRTGPA